MKSNCKNKKNITMLFEHNFFIHVQCVPILFVFNKYQIKTLYPTVVLVNESEHELDQRQKEFMSNSYILLHVHVKHHHWFFVISKAQYILHAFHVQTSSCIFGENLNPDLDALYHEPCK